MKNIKLLTVLIVGILLGSSLSHKVDVFAKSPSNIPLEDLRTFSQIFRNIKTDYVEDISDNELINNAISGMVSSLDPHSSYLTKDDFKDLTVNTSGKFGGLGIEVGMEDGFVKVISPIDDTPAKKAGIEAGDLIIRINDESVQGMTLNQAVKLMRGKIGTTIKITVVREGKDKPFVVKIIRDEIKIRSVKSKLLEKNYGYVRISQFQARTTLNLRDEIKKIIKDNKGKKLKGLILDLRNNPGGLLDSAVGVSNAFIKKGKIVYTKGRNRQSKSQYRADSTLMINEKTPLVVIINGGSASASEIVAGALQDHKRALIVGTKSFGKGSVQTVIPMRGGSGLKITTALYFTPKGRSIQAEGILPDIEIKPVKIEKTENLSRFRVFEKNLKGHLDNGNGKKSTKKIPESSVKEDKENKKVDLISTDFVLYESLNLLKGVALFR